MTKRLNANIPDEMHRRLRIALAEDGVTFQAWLEKQIGVYLKTKTPTKGKGG